MRNWDEVRKDLFTGEDAAAITAKEEQLRAQVRAHQLAEARKAQHLTQREVAAAMGVSIQRVSQIENGQLDRAEYGTLAAYVRALGGRPRLVADFGDKYLVIG